MLSQERLAQHNRNAYVSSPRCQAGELIGSGVLVCCWTDKGQELPAVISQFSGFTLVTNLVVRRDGITLFVVARRPSGAVAAMVPNGRVIAFPPKNAAVSEG